MDEPPSSKACPQKSGKAAWNERLHLLDKTKRAGDLFMTAVNRNNGIKEENILRLLVPVGIDPTDLDDVWLRRYDSIWG